nr:hypothetical protein [Tanacetum cinerariifolium]
MNPSDDSFCGSSDVDGQDDIFFTKSYEYHQSLQQQQDESSLSLNPIYREHDVEARLLADYFVDNPKYPAYYFRKRYRMSRKLYFRNSQSGANDDPVGLNNSPLFGDLISDIVHVASLELNGVTYDEARITEARFKDENNQAVDANVGNQEEPEVKDKQEVKKADDQEIQNIQYEEGKNVEDQQVSKADDDTDIDDFSCSLPHHKWADLTVK